MSPSQREYLSHILEELEFILTHSKGLKREDFLDDPILERAFTRSLTIIGEAVKRFSPEFRENHPDVDWKAIAGIRDKLIHDYFGIDYDILWDVIENKAPKLLARVKEYLKHEN